MGYDCPHCRRALGDFQGIFPVSIDCPGCGHEVDLPALELTSAVSPQRKRHVNHRPAAILVLLCILLLLVLLAAVAWWLGLANRLLSPDRYLIENYLREHVNDPRGFEIVEWSVQKHYVRDLNQQPATSYIVTVRARNVVGALTIHRMQVSVSNGEVIEAIQLD